MTLTENRWRSLFADRKPILAMLHLGGDDPTTRLERAVQEASVLTAGGVDGLIIENYFGDTDDVRAVLKDLAGAHPNVAIGLNVLHDFELAFSLAQEFPVDFIQMDSVAGHLAEEEDRSYAERLAELRASTTAALLGGVRFKYQPVLSGKSEADDIQRGMTRCDAIVVTGAGTGLETELSKLSRFRETVGVSFPLIVGAGVTDSNIVAQLENANGAIVGSFFKDNYRDDGIVDRAHVERLVAAAEHAQSAEAKEQL